MNLRNWVDLKPYLVKWDLVNSRDRKRERGEVVILEFGQLVLWFRIQGLFIFFKRLGGDFARLKGVFLPIYIFLGPRFSLRVPNSSISWFLWIDPFKKWTTMVVFVVSLVLRLCCGFCLRLKSKVKIWKVLHCLRSLLSLLLFKQACIKITYNIWSSGNRS